MTVHPSLTTYQDGVAVPKGPIRNYEKLVYFTVDVNTVRAADLTGTMICFVGKADGTTGTAFWHDATDFTTADDTDTCIEDFVGNRFKKKSIASSDLTAALLNAVLGVGGLSSDALETTALAQAFMGYATATGWGPTDITTLVSWFDTAIGNTTWRQAPYNPAAAGTVSALPSNAMPNAFGSDSRGLLFQDGTVGFAGSQYLDGKGNNTNSFRFMKMPFADGVDRNITKFWMGTTLQCAYALDSSGLIWAAGLGSTYGNLGIGSLTNAVAWTEITYFRTNGLTVVDVIPASAGAFFRTSNGQLYYTGYGAQGLRGDGVTTITSSPVRCGTLTSVTGVWVTSTDPISNFFDHVFVMAGGNLYAWGYNGNYELGLNNATTPWSTPQSTGLSNVSKVTGGIASVALKTDGTVWSCGYDGEGSTGQNVVTASTTKVWTQIAALGTTVLDIFSNGSRYSTMAAIVTVAGSGRYLRTWGPNTYGQLANGNVGTNNGTPQSPVATWQGSVDSVRFTGYHRTTDYTSMFVKVGNTIYAIGYNGAGQLSVGDSVNKSTFATVRGIRGSILSWTTFGTSNLGGLIVLTDEACLSGGYNSIGQTGTHEGNLASVLQLQEILTAGNIKGNDGAAFAFDKVDAIANKSTYDSQLAGYRFLAYDDSPTAKLYIRIGTTAGVWSSGIPVFGSYTFGAPLTPAAIVASQDNYAPTGYATAGVWRLSSTGAVNVTGLYPSGSPATDGAVILVENVGANAITLKDQNAGSAAANRFAFGQDISLTQYQSLALRYDGTLQKWVRWSFAGTDLASSYAWTGAHTFSSTVALNGAVTFGSTVSAIQCLAAILSSSASAGVGYAAGAGGTVTQLTSKSTGVSLAKMSGQITMNAAALAAATIVSFVLTNAGIGATDVLILNHVSGGTPGAYTLNAQCAAGTATINVRNNTAGSLSEAIVISFVVIKGVIT